MARSYGYGVGGGEAQVFNLAPYFNYFQQEQQKKRLEDQALNKQITDDLAKYTPDGLRQQDVPKFLNEYQNLKNLSLQYRDAIRNPAKNPKVWNEYQTAKTKLMGLIAESKAAKENTKALYDFRAHNLDKLDDDAFKQAMLLYNAPVGTPEFDQAKGFDQSQLIFKAPKMDLAKLYAPLNQLKPEETQTIEQLPTGQYKEFKSKQVSPRAIVQYMTGVYETDTMNAKKGFNDLFDNTTDEQKAQLESYAQKYYDPNFQINTPQDLAVASGLYGRANKSQMDDIKGSPYIYNRMAADARQQRSLAQQRDLAEKTAARKDKDDYLWETDIAKALKSNDTENIKRLATRLESSTPGTEYKYIKEGLTDAKWLNFYKNRLKKFGVDGKTKNLTAADFKAGVLLINIPRTTKEGIPIIDEETNDAERDYMAVSANEKFIENRLNKIKNYGADTKKPLADKVLKETPVQQPLYQFNVLDAPVDNEEN